MSDLMETEAPEGFRWEWVGEDPLEWRFATSEEAGRYKCRSSTRARCPNAPVAALNRRAHNWDRGTTRDAWWFYCADHMYGRRIRDGVIEHQRLVRDEP